MSIIVIERAFAVVEVMSRLGRPVSLAEIASESRLPKPTVYRILQSLRTLGYVKQTGERGSYMLTERLISLGRNDRYVEARRKALPLMQRLRKRFNETVNLAFLEGLFVNYVHVLETDQPLRWIVKPGARDPFHTTALGRAIVSHLDPKRQEQLINKVFPSRRARVQIKARDGLERKLALASKQGWALDEEESATGVACVAISLRSLDEPLAAVSVSVPMPRFTPELRDRIIAEFRAFEASSADAARRKELHRSGGRHDRNDSRTL
ncbi:MAG: IclR family transcriptional regulator [Opitutaceae bacterium]